MTDPHPLFYSVTCCLRTAKRRLTIYITASCDFYNNYYVERIGFARGWFNPAYDFSKPVGNGSLRCMMLSGKQETPVEQFTNGLCGNTKRVTTDVPDCCVRAAVGKSRPTKGRMVQWMAMNIWVAKVWIETGSLYTVKTSFLHRSVYTALFKCYSTRPYKAVD